MNMQARSLSPLGRDIGRGALVAGLLMAGAVIADTCTQIDAATKLVSYKERYEEYQAQIEGFQEWTDELESGLGSFSFSKEAALDALKGEAKSYATNWLVGTASEYGIDANAMMDLAGSDEAEIKSVLKDRVSNYAMDWMASEYGIDVQAMAEMAAGSNGGSVEAAKAELESRMKVYATNWIEAKGAEYGIDVQAAAALAESADAAGSDAMKAMMQDYALDWVADQGAAYGIDVHGLAALAEGGGDEALDILEERMKDYALNWLEAKGAEYGIDVSKAAALADTGELPTYMGRNLLGSNNPCLAAAMGLGRDVSPELRVVAECADYLVQRSVTSEPAAGGDLAPNAALSMSAMLSTSSGDWPVANVQREDLAWVRSLTGGDGRLTFSKAVEIVDELKDAPPEKIALAIARQMRLGDILTGRGASSVTSPGVLAPGVQDLSEAQRAAQVSRNGYAVEAIAREASVRPRLEQLRQALNEVNPDTLDQMTEGQRYAMRLSAQATVQEIMNLLQVSRMRQEQLMGIINAIEADRQQAVLLGGVQ